MLFLLFVQVHTSSHNCPLPLLVLLFELLFSRSLFSLLFCEVQPNCHVYNSPLLNTTPWALC